MATLYIGLTLEVLHHGHINPIRKGPEHGDVIIGLMTDRDTHLGLA